MNRIDVNHELDDLRQRVERLEAALPLTDEPEILIDEPETASCTCNETLIQTTTKNQINLAGETTYPEFREFGAVSGPIQRGRATIDGSRNDNGFLGCVYSAYRRTVNLVVLSHWSTAQAFANLRGGSEAFSIIVGHGAPGIIVCGTGQIVDGIDKYIAASNERYWRSIASRGITGTQLTLFGCKVAAGTAGTDLLRRVASAVRRPVGAWTGDVWCGGGRVWGTGTFVVVRPGVRLEAVEVVEVQDMYSEREPMNVLRLASPQDFEEVHVDQITSVQFTPIGSLPRPYKAVRAESSDARSLLQLIDFEKPLITEDKPGAILVGLLTITYGGGDDEEHSRTFQVLGGSLLQDVAFPNTYYYASEELQNLLLQ